MTVAAPQRPTLAPQLDIEIEPGADGLHLVRMRVAGRPDEGVDTTFHNPLAKDDVREANAIVDRGEMGRLQAKAHGARLFAALFHDDAAIRLLGRVSAQAPVRLRIVTADPMAAAIPWELLFDEDGDHYVARDGSVSRWLRNTAAIAAPVRPTEVDGVLRCLVITADPDDTGLDLEAEIAGIAQALAPAVRAGRAEAPVVLRAATRRAVQDALREAAEGGRPFHVVHFAGHTGRRPGSAQGHLLLGGDDGEVSPGSFAEMAGDGDVRLVVLNSCGSLQAGTSLSGHVLPGFAGELIQRGVPAVVGTQTPVIDSFAVALATDFYRALLDGRTVDGALTDVRRLIEEAADREHAGFGIPVCYLASGAGRIVTPPLPEQPFWQRHRRWLIGLVVVGIPTLFTYVSIVRDIVPIFGRDDPPPMVGDFNVAVAEFATSGSLSAEASTQALSLPASLVERLDDTLSCGESSGEVGTGGLVYDCRGPDAVGRFDGDDIRRAERAADYAGKVGAHLSVYGEVTETGSIATFAPEILISGGELDLAEELAGPHRLTTRSGDVSLLIARQQLRAEVELLADDLGRLAVALSFYAGARYAEALQIVGDLIDRGSFHLDEALLWLIAGNLRGKTGDAEGAEAAYRAALEATPGYGRAWVGLAEIPFHEGKGNDCAPGTVDAAALAESISRYETAIGQPVSPPAAYVGEKASFGIARGLLCLSVAGEGDHWAEAKRRLEGVTAHFEAGAAGLREFASEAYSMRGLIARSTIIGSDRPEALRTSIDLDRRAIELTRDPLRQARFHHNIALAQFELGDQEAGCASLVTSAELGNAGVAADQERFGCG